MLVLSVEDTPEIASALQVRFANEPQHDVDSLTFEQALESLASSSWDVVLADVSATRLSADTMIKMLRAEANGHIIAVGPSSWKDITTCLDAGAANTMSKPWHVEVLRAEIEALARRPASTQPLVLKVGSLEFDPVTRIFMVNGDRLRLTTHEEQTLELFIRKSGQKITVQDIDVTRGVETESNSAAVFVQRIRAKLFPHLDGTFEIETIRGLGYRLVEKAT